MRYMMSNQPSQKPPYSPQEHIELCKDLLKLLNIENQELVEMYINRKKAGPRTI